MIMRKLRTGGAAFLTAAFLLSLSAPAIFYGILPENAAVTADAAEPGVVETVPDLSAKESTPQPEVSEPGASGRKLIALTFDDGPRRSTTTRLLDGLAERGVKATFFLVGKNVEVNRDVVERMEQEGHQVGIHTYDHATKLTGLNHADFSAQVDKTRNLLAEILGHNGFVLRPPYGMTDAGVKSWAGAPIIIWSVDPEDWKDQNADREVAFITKEVKDGAIILMHDIFDASVDAALRVVDTLHEQGYLFVTIDELFDERHVALENGKIYWNAYP